MLIEPPDDSGPPLSTPAITAMYAAMFRATVRQGVPYSTIFELIDRAIAKGLNGRMMFAEAAEAYAERTGMPAPTLAEMRTRPNGVVGVRLADREATHNCEYCERPCFCDHGTAFEGHCWSCGRSDCPATSGPPIP